MPFCYYYHYYYYVLLSHSFHLALSIHLLSI